MRTITNLVVTFTMLITPNIAFAMAAIKTAIPARSILFLQPKDEESIATKERVTDFTVPINWIKKPFVHKK